MAAAPLIVGVDGGNTKTLALVCDLKGRPVGIGRGGSSNWEMQGTEPAAAVITHTVRQALDGAGGRWDDIRCAHMGLAGVDWPEDVPRMESALREAGWKCELSLENDAFSAIRVCTTTGYGIGVTAGTGVASGVVRPNGEKFFYGAYTDLGGGWEINQAVVHAIVRSGDGRGEHTALAPALLGVTGHATVSDLVYDMHRRSLTLESRVLRPLLFSVAAHGDPVAVRIVTSFGRELALCATNLIRRYRLEQEAVEVVAAGTLFMRTGPLLFDTFRARLSEAAPRARPILADCPPLMGAVRGALMLSGTYSPEAWKRMNDEIDERGWLREFSAVEAKESENG
ncbi:MAG: BadF/BadG/BcrA/BcrD ATPase family protein [Armatimonadota bacterium]|jgi:N-acetylglucosamine kinase-like BadF-type ATPase